MRTRLSILALVAALAASPSSTAQSSAQLPRGKVLGTALRADGTPWAGATIHFREPDAPTFLLQLEVDEVVTTARDDGRFDAALIQERNYEAWAEQELGDETHLVSLPDVQTMAGRTLTLRAQNGHRQETVLSFPGLETSSPGPFIVQLLDVTAAWTARITLGETHELALPVRPSSSCRFRVLDGHGQLVLSGDVSHDGARHVVTNTSPQVVRMRVTDQDTGGPIAEAVVESYAFDDRVTIGKTDAHGICDIHVSGSLSVIDGATWRPDHPALVRVRAARYASYSCELANLDVPSRTAFDEGPEATMSASLRRHAENAPPLRLRIGDVPLAHALVRARARVGDPRFRGSFVDDVPRYVTADAQGLVHLDELGDGLRAARLYVDLRVLRALPIAWRDRVSSTLMLEVGEGVTDLDLTTACRPVDFQLTAASAGNVVAYQRVVLGDTAWFLDTELRTDHSGRIRTLLPLTTRRPLAIVTCGAAGFAAKQFWPQGLPAALSGPDPTAPPRVGIDLAPSLAVHGRVTRGVLATLPATMDAFVSTATADHDRGFFYEAEPDAYEAAPDDGTVLSDLTGGPRLKGFLGLGSRTAVLDGRFESFAARIPGRLWLDVSTRHAGHEYFASRRVTLDEGTLDRASVEVELELAHRDR